ncbi:MAG: hypothetical protein ACRDM0_13950, partial [Thermoleophilaceae bacterium]
MRDRRDPAQEPAEGQTLAGEPGAGEVAVTPAARMAAYVRGGGVVVPVLTALLAFLIGGVAVLLAGKDPVATYEAIWKGTGLQWVFPWVTGEDRELAALNLQ